MQQHSTIIIITVTTHLCQLVLYGEAKEFGCMIKQVRNFKQERPLVLYDANRGIIIVEDFTLNGMFQSSIFEQMTPKDMRQLVKQSNS